MKKKSKFFYSSLIKLGVGIGDWTKLKPSDQFLDSIEISSIDNANFDFLSKEELKQSHLMHYELSEMIANHLSKDMNVKIELHTVMITQMTYADFIQSINSNVFQVDMNVPDFGNINVIFGSNLASMMVNRLTGGKGNNSSVDQFTDLERDILYTQIQEIVPHFQSIWNDVFDINESDVSLYSGQYKVDKRISYREAFVVFTFYLYFGGGELLRFMVAFPNDVLKKLMGAYNNKQRVLSPQVTLKEATLKKAEYDVVAKLGLSQLKMKDIQSLNVGDIVPLSNSINSPISLHISDQVKLYAQPCVYNNKIACQVIGPDNEQKVAVKLITKGQGADEAPELDSPLLAKAHVPSSEASVLKVAVEPSVVLDDAESQDDQVDLEAHLPEEIKETAPIQDEDSNEEAEIEAVVDESLEADTIEDEEDLLKDELTSDDDTDELTEEVAVNAIDDDELDLEDDDELDGDIDEDELEIDESDDLDVQEDDSIDDEDFLEEDDDDDDDDDEFDFEDDLFDDFEDDEEDSV